MLRTASSEGAVQLQHPTPDLQSLQGAYVQNVERLEETAERMSTASSDIGEEIRKMHLEQKLSDSRRSSMISAGVQEEEVQNTRSRNLSASSFTNSIVEVNNAARYGGYSPGGYISSPKGSLRSGSWSQVSMTPSIPRQRSISKGSRLGQMASLDDDVEMVQSPVEDVTLVGGIPQLSGLRISTDDTFATMYEQSSQQRDLQEQQTEARVPSDGTFTHLYNSMVGASNAAPQLSAPRIPSDTSFTDVYDQIATEIREQLHEAGPGGKTPDMNSSIQATPVEEQHPFAAPVGLASQPLSNYRRSQFLTAAPLIDDLEMAKRLSGLAPLDEESEEPRGALRIHRAESMDGREMARDGGFPDRPATAASTDTYQQAQTLFRDFDGAHYEPSILGRVRESTAALGARASMLKAPDRGIPPPPAPGMVFYPAPVPRTLNLPQRISQVPSAAIQAKHRTQMLSGLPADIRKSAPWLSQEQGRSVTEGAAGDRRSKMSMAKMAPQLRASIFFETPGSSQEVEMIDDSAVATLDDLLNLSANAPVSAFTDHPFVGRLGAEVYRKEGGAKNTSGPSMPKPEKADKKKRRSSILGLRRNSISTTDQLREENNKTPLKLQKRLSRSNSLGGLLDDSAMARGSDGEILGLTRTSEATPEREQGERDVENEYLDPEDFEEEEDEGDEPEYAGPPTTLLAELQQRKDRQKLRNRTAATAFPNGMHATLLEMDAIAQLQKSKRKKARVTLAWEDPDISAAADAAEKDDEDVPLGMLFPTKNKRDPADWNRPLGLLEKKELEDNEPLSRRRNRLLGVDMTRRTPSPQKQLQEAADSEDDSEHEGETLAQRSRRLKNQKELDKAMGDVTARPVSTAFSMEMLGELGIVDEKAKDEKEGDGSPATKSGGSGEQPSPNRSGRDTPDEEEETLGQRRARLQREAQAQARRVSRMSLGPEAQLGDELATGNDARRASTMLQTPATTPPLRASHSMADLLQAFPAGKFEARKISNEALTSALPPGSLLAQNEQKQAAQKARMDNHNNRTSSYGFEPLVDISADQRKSMYMGGMYNGASGAVPTAADQGLLLAAQENQQAAMMYGYQGGFAYPFNTGMQNYPYGNTAFAQSGYAMGMGMGMGMGMASPFGYPAQMMYGQAQPAMAAAAPQQQHLSAGAGAAPGIAGTMTNPNALLHNMGGALAGRSSANLLDPAYHPHLVRQSTMPDMHALQYEAFMDQKGRDRIDAWRLGVL